ncbi:MAG: hypothetical protein ACI81P_002070, partial [Neolewinella sp.]
CRLQVAGCKFRTKFMMMGDVVNFFSILEFFLA